VREVNALGSVWVSPDAVGIQFRLLNTSRGPAVWSPRAQCDKKQYRLKMREVLEQEPNLRIVQAEVAGLVIENGPPRQVKGVVLRDGRVFAAGAVIVTTGTFLNGLAHVGETTYSCGRNGEAPAQLLGEQLRQSGLRWTRLKTGTPPRLDGRTIDWSASNHSLAIRIRHHSRFDPGIDQEQVKCYIAYTTVKRVMSCLEQSQDRLYTAGRLERDWSAVLSLPRRQVHRFPDKERHQVLEPEGLDTYEVYVNGMSTSMPVDVKCHGGVHPSLEDAE
jgi:tRNA uridine 5-carboxymethylaminomethyl modification enzyme